MCETLKEKEQNHLEQILNSILTFTNVPTSTYTKALMKQDQEKLNKVKEYVDTRSFDASNEYSAT